MVGPLRAEHLCEIGKADERSDSARYYPYCITLGLVREARVLHILDFPGTSDGAQGITTFNTGGERWRRETPGLRRVLKVLKRE